MKKEVMKRAWEIKKENSANIFDLCLKMAWEEVKAPKSEWVNMPIKGHKTENYGNMILVAVGYESNCFEFVAIPRKCMRKIDNEWFVGINRNWEYSVATEKETVSGKVIRFIQNIKESGNQVIVSIMAY